MSAGLYIHIPFCVRKCKYCDFVSFPAPLAWRAAYLHALEREMALRAGEYGGETFDTVFFGGGTPSLLEGEALAALLASLRRHFSIEAGAEITLEANPGTLSADKLRAYAQAGVNRLSLGLQSADEGLLRRIGRIHSYADFLQSMEAAEKAGFSNINVDLMYALPGQTEALWADTLERVCALGPAHISAYALILEEGTPLFLENPTLPGEDEAYAMHLHARRYLQSRGYARYEISNYARPGMACRHNLHYWNMDGYLGLGLGAHSARQEAAGLARFYNTADMDAYLAALACGRLPEDGRERISRTDAMFEYVMLGLRKLEGVEEAAFFARFGQSLRAVYAPALAALGTRGWLDAGAPPGFVRLNETGLDLQNAALLLFMD